MISSKGGHAEARGVAWAPSLGVAGMSAASSDRGAFARSMLTRDRCSMDLVRGVVVEADAKGLSPNLMSFVADLTWASNAMLEGKLPASESVSMSFESVSLHQRKVLSLPLSFFLGHSPLKKI